MEYIKVSQVAEKWGISARRVRFLCAEGKVDGVIRKGKLYLVPETAMKPMDGRMSKTNIIAEAEYKKECLNKMCPFTYGEAERLIREFTVEFTYNSDAFEGNSLTLRETAMVLEGMTVEQRTLKDHLEAVGHRDAFLYVMDIASGRKSLNDSIIKTINSLVLINQPEDKGVYRRIPINIMSSAIVPVKPHLIEGSMEDLLKKNEERKKTMGVIERIALFHLEFEGIHPFVSGNGKTGRLIMNLELLQNGYPAVSIKFSDRKRYYDAFDSFYRDDDPNRMINLVAEYVDESLNRYLDVLKEV